jgi:hypothetical protein
MARGFRTWLTKAKVTRAELHTSTPTRKAITVYDLRATGITLARDSRGRPDENHAAR